MARLSNEARKDHWRPAFVLDRELSRVARTHTADMIEREELEHTASAQLAGWTTNWVELTENIGKGSDAESLFETFMHSAPHRYRILRARYNHIGIGILRDDRGQMWVTIVFESRRDPGTSLPRPMCG